jgi:hypothetical protein
MSEPDRKAIRKESNEIKERDRIQKQRISMKRKRKGMRCACMR